MVPVLPALSLLVVNAATLDASSLPGAGRAETLLTLDAPTAIHFTAKSASGTSCEFIDRVRGPFARSGTVGGANCELDLLLDAGQYKVRVESPMKAKGSVTLAATPFTELNTGSVRLDPGSAMSGRLKPGQQATFWLSLKQAAVPMVRISGRNAGDVVLWRNGEWAEDVKPHHTTFSPRPGQPMHEWWFDTRVEAGDYKLVVYGRNPTNVADGSVDDSLTIETGLRPGPAERSLSFTLPASGIFAVRVPSASLVGVLTVLSQVTSPIVLQSIQNNVRSPRDSCVLDGTRTRANCSVTAMSTGDELTALIVRGAPGTRGMLEWADWRTTDAGKSGGYFGPLSTSMGFTARKGRYVVGINDVPYDDDASPLGCLLERLDGNGDVQSIAGSSVPSFSAGERLQFDFNSSGYESVWFELKEASALKRVFSSSRFRIKTKSDTKSTCEIFRISGASKLERISQTSDKPCNQLVSLSPGLYQVSLQGGLSGIESLSISNDGDGEVKPLAMKGTCLMPNVTLEDGRYRLNLNRGGTVAARGVEVSSLPLSGREPVRLRLEARQSISLPVQDAGGALVRSSGGVPFGCAMEKGTAVTRAGECELPSGTDTLKLANTSDVALTLTVGRPGTLPSFTSPVTYSPTLIPIPRIALDSPTWFDFARQQTQSAAFDVDQPGLYNVTTVGLLSTSCSLRTPTVAAVAQNANGGRGRNCLIQTYLQKGRYLLSATTTGQSTGRGALTLSRRPAKEFPGITGEGEQFFRVDANELVQQKLNVKSAGRYSLATTSQGSSLQCRFDDPEGWPLVPVPSQCEGTRDLKAGTYLWTQLPLTVESMRRTQLKKEREAVTLKGNKPHKLEAFTWYTAELGSDGKDEFLFSLEGETQLDVVLTAGMQGRVFVLEKDKQPRAVEVIAPMETASSEGEGEEESSEDESDYREEREYSEEESSDEEGNTTAPVQVAQARAAPPPPSGVKITLPAGQYKLVTEHARGDVGVTYQLHLGSAVLLPGMTRTVPAPTLLPLFVPRDGTLRLRTEGQVDVRCRVLDERKRVVLEGSENGSDWNCAIAEPIRQGRYTLVLESETQQPGETTVTVALPTVEDKGTFADATKLTLGASVVSFALPVAEKDSVLEVAVRAQGKTPLSCALEDPTGNVVHRLSRVTDCTMLVRPQLTKYRVRAWTTDGSAPVVTSLRTRPIVNGSAGTLAADAAVSISVAHAGRYKTSGSIFCITGNVTGLMRWCGPEVSLEAGGTIFSAAGNKAQPLSLDESIGVADGKSFSLPIDRQPFVQVVKPGASSLVLMEARVQHGERAAPSCAFDGNGTVRERRDASCFAASRLGGEATSRLWAPVDFGIDTSVVRRAVTPPTNAEALAIGRARMAFTNVGRFAFPKQTRARVELTLPADAWAVLLADDGAALDLCAPTGDLRRCTLTNQGGSVVVVSKENGVDVTTIALEGAAATVKFSGLYEATPRAPGTVRLSIAPGDAERALLVEGALRCTVALEDGTRVASCRSRIPAKTGAELIIEHGTEAVRAMVHAPGREKWARLGIEMPVVPGASLASSTAVPLQSGRIDRTLVLDKEAVVRVASESGVCGLFRGNELLSVDGLDAGCELVRVLSPGTYRLLVRPFAGHVQPGSLRWSADPVTQLSEGVGAEDRLAPGEVRLYRFDTTNKGKVGLGVRAKSELLECAVYDDTYQLVGEGCHQYLSLAKGRYLLTVRNPPRDGAAPIALNPVLLGLSGENNDVPEEYLRGLLQRAGVSR
ncbi:MAG: hypothetical protein ACO1OB_11120 [Archangium sp.]